MKKWLLFSAFLTGCFTVRAQDLDSLFENGQNEGIVRLYETATRSFGHNELETVAAAYDRLGRLSEEEKVLGWLISSFPLFLTFAIPTDYYSYHNFIEAGLMEKYRSSITSQYLKSVKDTSLWDPLESTCRHASLSIL